MIHSLFIINKHGDIFMEKHWKSVIHKSICDYFFEEQKKNKEYINISPIISTPKHILINIYRSKLFFVAVLSTECPPLFVIEFLHRIVDTIVDYFQDCNESIIKENYVLIYEILDEMLDDGYPLITEPNILKELIKPPNLFRTLTNTVTGKSNLSEELPKNHFSAVPWRRTGIKYTNNEAYFDIVEEIDAIIDRYGSIVSSEIQGNIDCCIKLSGMPELMMCFSNPRILDDVSFHPCVRLKNWEMDKRLIFIPPDGNFRLMSYKVSNSNNMGNNILPVLIQHSITYNTSNSKLNSSSNGENIGGITYNTGKFDIIVAPRNTMGKQIESCSLSTLMPKSVLNLNLIASQGNYSYDPVSKKLEWIIGKIELYKGSPQLKGTITLQPGTVAPEFNPTINLNFSIPQLTVSGLRVSRLDMSDIEKYKPFKGVKYVTKAGKFQIRT